MSDAKWVRLLNALTASEGMVAACQLKLVWHDNVRELAIDGCQFEFDYWHHAMEAMITGTPRGWYDYKGIEWVEFPSKSQDTSAIEQTINSVGPFDLERTTQGLRLYAYR